MYMLAGTCGLLATYWLVRTVGAGREWMDGAGPGDGATSWGDKGWRVVQPWVWYVASMVAAMYTIYLSVVFLMVHNLWVVVLAVRDRLPSRWAYLRRWILAQVTVGALLLPWLALSIPRMSSWRIVEEPPSLRFVAQLWVTLLATGTSADIGTAWLPTAAVVLILLAGTLYVAYKSLITRYSLLILFLVIPPFLVWAVTQPRSIFYSPRVEARYLLPFAAPLYVLLAGSVWGLWRRWRLLGVAALVVVVAVFVGVLPTHYRDRYLRDELQTMTQVIRAYAQPDDGVVLVSGNRYPLFLYYYEQALDSGAQPTVYRLPAGGEEFHAANVEDKLRPIASRHNRVWLAEVDRHLQDPAGLAQTWLGEHRQRLLSFGFDHNALHLYADLPGEPTVRGAPWLEPLDIALGDGQALGYDLLTEEYRPGDEVRLGVYLTAAAPLRLPVRWVHEGGHPLTEVVLDVPATGDDVVRRHIAFEATDAVPAGDYHFEIHRPPDAGTTPSEGDVQFGRVQVTRTHGPSAGAQPDTPLDVGIGDQVRLAGYTLRDASGRPATTVLPGQTLYIDLFWQATQSIDRRLTVFTHLLGAAHNPETGGPVWAGHDSEPVMGAAPTTRWPVGTTIADRHPLLVDTDIPPGEYQIEVGLYDPTTGERLPVSGEGADVAGRRVLLGTVNVG